MFLAEDTILLPAGQDGSSLDIYNSLDIYHIPRTGEAVIIHSFHLPPLIPYHYISSASCRGFPPCVRANSHTPPTSQRRYTSEFETSLIVVSFDITSDADNVGKQFTFVFLRNEFVDMLRARTNAGHPSTEWPLWGPWLTRWLDMRKPNYHMAHGRRLVWIPPTGGLRPIYMLDFNPHAVILAQEKNKIPPTATIRVVPRHQVTVIRYRAFQSPVRSTLPYVETVSTAVFKYESVAIIEDNILGLQVRVLPRSLRFTYFL